MPVEIVQTRFSSTDCGYSLLWAPVCRNKGVDYQGYRIPSSLQPKTRASLFQNLELSS